MRGAVGALLLLLLLSHMWLVATVLDIAVQKELIIASPPLIILSH